MSSSIKKSVNKHFGEIEDNCGIRITRASLGLILHVINSSTLTKIVKEEVSNTSIMAFKNDLKAGYFIKNIKLWLWSSVCQGHNIKQTIKSMPDFDIKPEDKVLAYVLFNFKPLLKGVKDLAKKLDYKYHTLAKFDKIVVRCIDECDGSMFNLTKTMNFMVGPYLSRDDLKSELCRHGIFSVYKQYPKIDSFDHCINVYRRGARNSSINMIQQHNGKGRATFSHDSEGKKIATLVPIVSINAFDSTDRTYLPISQRSNIDGSKVLDEDEESDVGFSVNRLKKKARTPKQKEFIDILSGNHSVDFCEWLKENNYSKDNDELFDFFLSQGKLSNYINLCTSYLGINSVTAKSFIHSLRTMVR